MITNKVREYLRLKRKIFKDKKIEKEMTFKQIVTHDKLERYRTALIRGRKHHKHCYGDPHCGCICGLEEEMEGDK